MKLSVAECRRILGKTAESLTDEEVKRISNVLDSFAEMFIESFLLQNYTKNDDGEK